MKNYLRSIDDARSKLISAGIASPDSFVGCADEELQTLERALGRPFPAAYSFFLRLMGHGAGAFYEGTDWRFSLLEELQSAAKRLIDECSPSYLLPTDAFVFAMHQGYSFLFFHLDGEDPPVFLYVEYDNAPKKISNSFSEWFRDCVADQVRHEGHR